MSTIRKQTELSSMRTAATALKQHLKKADANGDGRVTEAEVKRYAKSVRQPKAVGDAMVTMTNWALQGQSGAISVKSVTKKVDEAMTLISARDTNRNGKIDTGRELSAANSLKTFQALANMASAIDVVAPSTGKLTAKKLGDAIAPWARDANYMSEGDYSPRYFTVAGTGTITDRTAVSVLGPALKKFYDDEQSDSPVSLSDLAAEVDSAREAKAFIEGLTDDPDEDPIIVEGWTQVTKLLGDNLTDLKVLKVGPKDEDGSLATDQGLYAYVIVGKTSDGKTAGVLIGSVET